MTSIKLIVHGTKVRAEVDGILTSGSVGIPVTIQYDSTWDDLSKTLVCTSGKLGPTGTRKTILNADDSAYVAHEVMIADNHLYLGIEGRRAHSTIVVTTVWADCGKIYPGADANASPSAKATLPIWAQLQQQINDIKVNGIKDVFTESTQNAYMLPIANADTLGGVMPVTKTKTMTHPVGVDEKGRLYTEPSDSDGTDDYTALNNKPKINGIELTGNMSGEDLGISNPTDAQVASAVSTWLEEHPEATTTVADGSITQEKLAFAAYEGVLSPNLIDPDALVSARFSNANGNMQTFTDGAYYNSWRMTGFIDVSDHIGQRVWVHNYQGHCFYDANQSPISGSGNFDSSFSDANNTLGIAIPDGASFVRLAMFYAAGRVYIANFGDELFTYTPYGQVTLAENSVSGKNISGKLPLDKIDTSQLVQPTIGFNLIDKSKMVKNYKMSTAGTPTAVAESLSNWYVTDIPVTGGDTYLLYGNDIVFFDTYGNVCGSDSAGGYRTITAPASAVYCAVNSVDYGDVPAHMEHGAFLIHGNTLPNRVVNAKYYEADALDSKALYKSVLSRMADCWNPSTKTVIGLYGDSNTIGIEGSGNTTRNPDCWANLLTNEIHRKLSGERYIYPFGNIGVWGCAAYNSREAVMKSTGVIRIPFYGTSISMNSGTVATVPKQFHVSIDDGEQVLHTIEEAGTYNWAGLAEGYHTITLIPADNVQFLISKFVVNKTVEVINRGISGRNLANITTDVGMVSDTIEIICSGTNNRSTKNVLESERELVLWEYQNHATKLIYVTPIPAWDDIENTNEAWATIPYIESFIAGREARKNCEYISLYNEIKDYCINNNVELSSLYAEGLHLNDAGHKAVAQILCKKLGLGDLTEST